MKHLAFTLSIALLFAVATEAAPVIFIVRHAEKATAGSDDPDLSLGGQKRADALAKILQDAKITSIFVTEFKRTQQTAAPAARAAHLTPTVIPANDVAALIGKLRALNGNALVVGHGNTIPELLKALAVAAPITIPEDDYSEIFVLSLYDPPQLLRLHYSF
ncbi:MAG TPA: phosphoglycerate mutase family protein [Candidatus Udaeobacter sp.]|nr:phosphoglycerate mutase family protein [Candidatus Udaeobacter sp.]